MSQSSSQAHTSGSPDVVVIGGGPAGSTVSTLLAKQGYRVQLFDQRVSARFQLNLSNAFESGALRPIAVNPDGQVYNYRIINPRQLVLTARFEF